MTVVYISSMAHITVDGIFHGMLSVALFYLLLMVNPRGKVTHKVYLCMASCFVGAVRPSEERPFFLLIPSFSLPHSNICLVMQCLSPKAAARETCHPLGFPRMNSPLLQQNCQLCKQSQRKLPCLSTSLRKQPIILNALVSRGNDNWGMSDLHYWLVLLIGWKFACDFWAPSSGVVFSGKLLVALWHWWLFSQVTCPHRIIIRFWETAHLPPLS